MNSLGNEWTEDRTNRICCQIDPGDLMGLTVLLVLLVLSNNHCLSGEFEMRLPCGAFSKEIRKDGLVA